MAENNDILQMWYQKQMMRASRALPNGYVLNINIVHGGWGAELIYPTGAVFYTDDGDLSDQLKFLVEHAIEHNKT